jgi:hypothetical protein
MRNNTRTERMRKKALRPAKDPLRNEDVLPGWYWRTPEGQAFIKMISAQSPADVVDDPEIGWQREED